MQSERSSAPPRVRSEHLKIQRYETNLNNPFPASEIRCGTSRLPRCGGRSGALDKAPARPNGHRHVVQPRCCAAHAGPTAQAGPLLRKHADRSRRRQFANTRKRNRSTVPNAAGRMQDTNRTEADERLDAEESPAKPGNEIPSGGRAGKWTDEIRAIHSPQSPRYAIVLPADAETGNSGAAKHDPPGNSPSQSTDQTRLHEAEMSRARDDQMIQQADVEQRSGRSDPLGQHLILRTGFRGTRGWLCTRINCVASSSKAHFTTRR